MSRRYASSARHSRTSSPHLVERDRAARGGTDGEGAATPDRGRRVMGLIKLVIRVLALVGKEIMEVFRRPGAVLSLVLGPFLILAVFGAGYQGYKKDLVAIIVVDPASALPQEAEAYRDLGVRGINIVEVTPDRAAAEAGSGPTRSTS